jgi:hypothetical protein
MEQSSLPEFIDLIDTIAILEQAYTYSLAARYIFQMLSEV